MQNGNLPTLEQLYELLDYDPETGVFRWKVRKNNRWANRPTAGALSAKGYIYICIDGVMCLAHRLAWLYVHGTRPAILDHINGDKADNRIANLREATIQQNFANRGALRTNTSGLKGVSLDKGGAWRARLMVNGRSIYLGRFPTAEAAHAAYLDAARKHHGEFAHTG